MKKIVLSLLLICIINTAFSQLNITFKSNLPYPGNDLSNIGGYVDSLGNEYALVGYQQGMSIVNVTDPANPVVAFDVQGINSQWREVKVWEKHAYVTTEGCCDGLQIIDLSNLPATVTTTYWKGNGAINNQLETIHALHIDAGYAYLFGSNLFNGAAIIVDISNPLSLNYVGHTPGTYIHDGYVRNDTLWGCHIYDGYFSVMDVSNKANPILLTTVITPSSFTHNSWLNDAGTVLFTTDEVANSYLAAYDITDINNITELDRFQLTPNSGSIVHNTHTLNDFEVVSWYKDGIAIVDVARPDNMILVGSYDTYAQGSGNGFNGSWGVYPYLPSGNLVVSDIDNGLYVLTPDYVRGCYLEGTVTDSTSGIVLNNVAVEILSTSILKQTKLNGEYKTGYAIAGLYDVQFSKAGYITKTISGVSLQNGILTNLDVQLSSLSSVSISGQVLNAVTLQPIANAKVIYKNSQFDNNVTSNSNGDYSIPTFFPGTYDVTIGAWGYRTDCATTAITSAGTFVTYLIPGYYDDFSLDFGWTVTGPSNNKWEIGVPIATTNNGVTCNPGNDVSGDCYNTCYITDNGGGGAWDNDVDQGSTILNSPNFDLTTYVNPVIKYSRWFYNGGLLNGAPDDTMKVLLTNGTTTIELERMTPTTPGNGTWVNQLFFVGGLIPFTNTMKLIVNIGDPGPIFNIVEGGLDLFEVVEAVGLEENMVLNQFTAGPNPFSDQIKINFNLSKEKQGTRLNVYNSLGKLVLTETLNSTEGSLEIGSNWESGIYLIVVNHADGKIESKRVIKNK
jgi:choice-of-anchor B domain-containing protein